MGWETLYLYVSLRCHVEVVDHASPPEIEWLRHVAVNGSLHDDDGAANLRTLQSCRYVRLPVLFECC